uniref:B30.2/SPRY domain-containing protein n=1 Tax=Labrus bergylta TaxID=56723 RepID=A0A3Q3H398_9LABR
MSEEQTSCWSKIFRKKHNQIHLYQSSVDKALQSRNGHLDLFLRFVLGLSMESSQTLLQGLLTQTGSSLEMRQTKDKTVEYIKMMIRDSPCPERSINLLGDCNLSWRKCEALASVLSLQSSCLRELDLSNNDLQDLGVELLSGGLGSTNCTLEILRLSGCLIQEKGCAALVAALKSNPSHLRELDLSYNHPGDSGLKTLYAGLKDPNWRLDTLKKLKLSHNNRKVMAVREEQPYPDHPERFDYCQLLCTNGLTGRCYWEVEWEGKVHIAVTYKEIRRKGYSADCWFGGSDQSWNLHCSKEHYSVYHNLRETLIPLSMTSTNRVAVYVDCPAGTLSFYTVSSDDSLTHLHTFNTTFNKLLYPGFRFWSGLDSSVSLCEL